MTLDYYNHNAESFRQRTAGSMTRRSYDAFLARLAPNAHILDAGCGPGRDSMVFLERGFRVTGMDASLAMVEMATQATGQPVLLMTFQQIEFQNEFDAIWANASLLHVPQSEIDGVIRRLTRALKPAGALYMSLKVGDGERIADDGRFFCDYTETAARELLSRHRALTILEIHQTPPGPNRADGRAWLHVMCGRN